MAKTLYFTDVSATTHRGTNSTNLVGNAVWWFAQSLSENRGNDTSGTVSVSMDAPPTGASVGVEVNVAGPKLVEWITEPLSADFTISGTITVNLWVRENAMTDNVASNFVVDKMDGATGTITQIVKSARVTEEGTTSAAANFTATPTSTACKRGDRLRVRIFADDVGGFGTAANFIFNYDRSTASVTGDSWIQFTENLTFELAGDPGILTQTLGGSDQDITSGGTLRYAQSFIAQGNLNEVRLRVRQDVLGSVANFDVSIRDDSAGSPGTTVATVASIAPGSINVSASGYGQLTVSGLNITLTKGTTYWLVYGEGNYYIESSTTAVFGVHKKFTTGAWSAQPGAVWVYLGFQVSTYYLTDTQSGLSTVPALLTDFTGADENPLSDGGNWAQLNTANPQLKRISNAVMGSSSSICYSYWTPTNFGPDLEAYCTLTTMVSTLRQGIVFRVQGEGGASTWDGYEVNAAGGSATTTIAVVTNATATNLIQQTANGNWGSGDKLGVRCKGSLIQVWRQRSGFSTWELIASVIDATYSAAGKIGLRIVEPSSGPVTDDLYVATNSNLFTQKALTTRGSGSTAVSIPTATGPVTPLLVNEWYTPPLNAVTLGGKSKFNIRGLESSASANASLKAEIAICNSDGSSPVVWGIADIEGTISVFTIGEILTSDSAYFAWVSGDDTAVTLGKRLRFRIYVDDCGSDPLVTAFTVTVSYNGASAAAAGDTYVILPQAVTEALPSAYFNQIPYRYN